MSFRHSTEDVEIILEYATLEPRKEIHSKEISCEFETQNGVKY